MITAVKEGHYAKRVVAINAVANFSSCETQTQEGIMPKGKSRGSCGGTPRRDGSGGGKGNKGTKRQPPKKKK